MFEIYGGATEFNQWDLDKMVINSCMNEGDEVVFYKSNGETYPVKATRYFGSVVANVPNYILQTAGNILVSLGQGNEKHDDCETIFSVVAADKPGDYNCKCNVSQPLLNGESTGNIEMVLKAGIASETISRHSVTYRDETTTNFTNGYPSSLMGFLLPYKKARFGRGISV